ANTNSLGFEIIDPIGKKFDNRDIFDVVKFTEGTFPEGTDIVITRVIRPQINKNGVLEQRAQVEVMQSATKEEIENAISAFKEDSINKRKKEINAKYDAEIASLESKTTTSSGNAVQTPSPQNQQKIEQLEREIERLERIQKNIPQEPK